MKGIVFNLLEEAVIRQYGENTWDDLLEAAGLDRAYHDRTAPLHVAWRRIVCDRDPR